MTTVGVPQNVQLPRNILLMVTGGIAAYKTCFLARLLVQAGFSVRCAMTESAQRFVGPVTMRSLTGHGVATDLWGEGDTDPLDHVDFARWADIAVVAPATANLLGKAANGIADDIVTTLLMAFDGPLVLAPAMNDAMWRHPATQANLDQLRTRGAHVVEPGTGWLACGVVAEGRMAEPEEILGRVVALAQALPVRSEAERAALQPTGPLSGKRVLVTAGPTREPIDAIRYITNRSTGSFGFALAYEAAALGAEVVLVHGPVVAPVPRGIGDVVAVETSSEMAAAVRDHLQDSDLLIMAAAVADFTPVAPVEGKLKKESLGTSWNVAMMRTTDILAEIVGRHRPAGLKVVGFALETEDLLERAAAKMRAKGMDCVVANNPTGDQGSFGDGAHRVWLLGSDGVIWDSGSSDKAHIAHGLMEQLIPLLDGDEA